VDQQTQKAKSVVFGLCFIPQVNNAPSNYKKHCYPANTIIAGKCCTCGESEWSPLNARLQGASAENLLEEGISYIINHAKKTPLIKYITVEQRPRH